MPESRRALRSAIASSRQAFANDGVRRLGISFTLGVAADTALFVVSLVTVYDRGGALAAAKVKKSFAERRKAVRKLKNANSVARQAGKAALAAGLAAAVQTAASEMARRRR